MSRGQPITYNSPPMAGRPPYATDEPDSIYQTGPSVQARYRQPEPHSYDTYLNDPSDQDERNPFRNPSENSYNIPLAAPRPGYAAPVAALNLSRPSPAATPDGRMPGDMSQLSVQGVTVPSTPHPLQAPMTPIAPAFARPNTSPSPRDVTFASHKPLIMRGDKEETLLPKRGEKGDDFWRRFSVIVKEETKVQHKSSNWLNKTQNGISRLSRWAWVIAFLCIVCIAGACVLGWYVSQNKPDHSPPVSVDSGAKDGAYSSTHSSPVAGGLATSSSHHVSPTYTLNDKRELLPEPSPNPGPDGVFEYHAHQLHDRHHKRSQLNRGDFH